MTTTSTPELAQAREEAAAELEQAIAAVGAAYRRYESLTSAMGDRVGEDLTQRLAVPIVLHFAQAGLSGFLARKLHGPVAALRVLVEEQHQRFTGRG